MSSSSTSSTKLTTVRIHRELYNIVLKDAQNEGIGFTTFLNRLLRKYVEWDKPVQAITTLSVPKDVATEFLKLIVEHDLKTLARDIAPMIREIAEFWSVRSTDHDSLLELFKLFCKYGGFGTIHVEKSGKEEIVHMRHLLGIAGSTLLATLVHSLFDASEVKSKIETGNNSLTVRFMPRSKTKVRS